MAYTSSDPRSQLATADRQAGDEGIAAPEFADFTATPPTAVSDLGSRTWFVRAQNVVLAHTEAVAGEVLARTGDTDEYVVLLPHEISTARVRAGGAEVELAGQGLIVVPPGDSEVVAAAATHLVRLFRPDAPGVAAAAANAASYAEPHPRVAIEDRWPAPVDGDRLRVYPVGEIGRSPDRFGRIFRTRSFMVNFLYPHQGPRDPEKLSPHHHDDFEQVSLAVRGEFTHHIRTPWTTARSRWREDVHETLPSPSVTVIPPPTVHTSEAVGAGLNQLVDIFAPPRRDFSARPGWVLNADEYPAP
ncbi:cupin domain-containing protein [Pseudonocardia sp. DLS-67]